MSADEQSRFLQELAEDLNSKNIQLPSFPDVVINIRTALEDPTCSSERLAAVVRIDAVLVARLLMSANSAFHNRAGIEIIDLDLAVSRLGFEVVRNTAIALAVEQIFAAAEYKHLKSSIKAIWSSSLSLASMSFVIAKNAGNVNADNAFLCGLLHEIGSLYILTKARNYSELMGDKASLQLVQEQWNANVGKAIIEAWGFSSEISASIESEEHLVDDPNSAATLVDVVFLAKLVLAENDELAENDAFAGPAAKLNLDADALPSVRQAYNLHAQSMRRLAGG